MTDWKEYKIVSKKFTNIGVEFGLNGQVIYGTNRGNFIIFKKIFPFTEWDVGDEIVIDISETEKVLCYHVFSFMAYKKGSRWEDKYWEVVREKNNLGSKISELESRINSSESDSSRQLVLRRNVEADLSVVRRERNNLESRVSDLQSSNWSLQSANTGLSSQLMQKDKDLEQKNRDIEWGKNQLALSQRGEKEKQTKIDELTCQLTTLQITNNNINREIAEKKNEIKNLKGDLNISREEYLNQKIGIKQEKLETLVQQLGINQGQIDNLKDAYRQLIEARENFNQNNINVANANINNLRVALTVNPTNRQKVCRKCEKLVKLEIELNQIYQQQYEARQEVPPRT